MILVFVGTPVSVNPFWGSDCQARGYQFSHQISGHAQQRPWDIYPQAFSSTWHWRIHIICYIYIKFFFCVDPQMCTCRWGFAGENCRRRHCQMIPRWAIKTGNADSSGKWNPWRELQFEIDLSSDSDGAAQTQLTSDCSKLNVCILIKHWNSQHFLEEKAKVFIFFFFWKKRLENTKTGG